MKCSQLSADLYDLHIIENSACYCGHLYEDSRHYFFDCPLYNHPRSKLHNSIIIMLANTWNLYCLLFGDNEMSIEQNERIVKSSFHYINR